MYINKIKNIRKSFDNNIKKTQLDFDDFLSEKYNANIYLKREDLQQTRSFKIRGSYNKIMNINPEILADKNLRLVTASAGNHSQGFAYCCAKLQIKGTIFLPISTPNQKVDRIKYFSKDFCEIIHFGNNFNETLVKATQFSDDNNCVFIHPFDDYDVIDGQATIADELLSQINNIDIIIVPVGGGGLISGVARYLKEFDSNITIIGVEPEGCQSMKLSYDFNKRIFIDNIDTFVDGASVPQIGKIPFDISRNLIDAFLSPKNGELCGEILRLYNQNGIIVEPAGGLATSVLNQLDTNMIKNKNIICLLSGGNNDLLRYNDYLNKYLVFKNLRHYFTINFKQKPGELKNFVNNVLGDSDDIIKFEYLKKTNNTSGSVFVGLEISNESNLNLIINNMIKFNYIFNKISPSDNLYDLLV
tara:strand:- start:1972 stop:3219 length:1248 start_codon:yes stop_codon:yes gene_type:complete